MKSLKHFLLMFLLVAFPLCAMAQGQSRGDQLYSEAVALIENGSKASLNKAITTLKKAKLAYESSVNKNKCDAKIKEAQKLLKSNKDSSSKPKEVGNRKQAEQYFNYATEELNKGNLEVAKEYFTKAKNDFPPTDTESIAKCDEGILMSSQPLKFEQSEIAVNCLGDEPVVKVISLLTGNWMVRPVEADWVHPIMAQDGLRIDVDENETNAQRECTVTISHSGDKYIAQLKVLQYGSIGYQIDGEDDDVFYLKFKNNDKSKLLVTKISVPDNAEWEIVRDSTDQWIFPEPSNNSIGVTVSKHSGKEGRMGRIAVAYQKDGTRNITYVPVYQGTKLSAKLTSGMKKGWKSFTGIFTGK